MMVFSSHAAQIQLDFAGLEDLGPDYRYEGWLIDSGSPVSTGLFSVNASGDAERSTFTVDDGVLSRASLFVLTIEPFPDADPAPASTHILAGPVVNQSAELTVSHPAALGDDFSTSTGDFILAAPSDTGALGSYVNGIWYLVPPNPDAGLDLPVLPPGWVYEGWVVDTSAGTPISTGRFLSGNGADSDAGGATAGPGGTPNFPGQDFINPLRDLTDAHLAVISVEPEPDNSPNPFTLKPLVKAITDPGAPGVPQSMDNNANASNPTGGMTMFVPQVVPSLNFWGITILLMIISLVSFRQFELKKT